MAEYVPGPDEDVSDVARRLLSAVGDPDSVAWSPRPNMHPHGGLFTFPDADLERISAAAVQRLDEVSADTETSEEIGEDEADEATEDDPSTPDVDEHAEAQDRVAKRRAARKAATAAPVAPADEQKSE